MTQEPFYLLITVIIPIKYAFPRHGSIMHVKLKLFSELLLFYQASFYELFFLQFLEIGQQLLRNIYPNPYLEYSPAVSTQCTYLPVFFFKQVTQRSIKQTTIYDILRILQILVEKDFIDNYKEIL